MKSSVTVRANPRQAWRSDQFLWIILGVALLLGIAYNFAILPGFGPDEPRHFNYIKVLLYDHRLPLLLPDGSEFHGAHSLHPPLYYVYLIPFYLFGKVLPGDAVWHITRFGSLILCLAALPFIYQLGFVVGGKWVGRLSTALIGWLPMWGMTAGTLNNDSANFIAVAVFLWLLSIVYADDDSYKSAIILGIALGLGTLTKATAMLCCGVALLLYFWFQYGKTFYKSPRFWGRLGTVIGVAAFIAGWWNMRSIIVYGTLLPASPAIPSPFLPDPSYGVLIQMMHPNFPTVFGYANLRLFETIWSQKDWLLLSSQSNWLRDGIRNGIYIIFALLALGGAAGYILRSLKRHGEKEKVLLSARLSKVLSGAAFIVSWFVVLQVALFWAWGWAEGGRYLLGGLCGYTIWNSHGLSLLLKRKFSILVIIIGIFLIAVNIIAIYWLILYLNPTFGSTLPNLPH